MTAERSVRLLVLALVPLGLILFALANTHLVGVALESQPDCVPHLKEPGRDGIYRAAKPAC